MESTGHRAAGFDVVMRGYDRTQVDERLRFLGAELAAAEQALGVAQERASAAEREVAAARSELTRLGAPVPNPTFGERVERILRLAEEEAAEVRSRAAAEVAETLQHARTEAEQLVAAARATAQRREQDAQRELDRLGALRTEVQDRLRTARSLLDEHLAETEDVACGDGTRARGRALTSTTGKMGTTGKVGTTGKMATSPTGEEDS